MVKKINLVEVIVGIAKATIPKPRPWQQTEKYKKMTLAEKAREVNKRARERREGIKEQIARINKERERRERIRDRKK